MISEVQRRAANSSISPHPLSIWIIEDNTSDVVLVGLALRRLSFACDLTPIADGEAALGYIAEVESSAIAHLPDMIFLDLNLPKIDGLAVLRAIRSSRRFGQVPVAILTSSAVPSDKKAIADLGANCYVHKIPQLEEFFSAVSDAVLDLRPGSELQRDTALIN